MNAGARQPRVNYDEIAHLYDEPLRDHTADRHLIAFLAARTGGAPVRILDVGCGTGKQLAANRAQLPKVLMAGVDRFAGMLRIAQKRCPSVGWLQADGAELPLALQSFDYASSQYAYPHIGRTERLIAELFRVLKPGGRFVMTNIDPWAMAGWLLYRFFPEAYELDQQDFVRVDTFVALMRAAGFENVTVVREDKSIRQTLGDFQTYASARHRTSHFMALRDEAYLAGLQRLQRAIDDDDGSEKLSAFSLVTIAGDKS